MTTTEPDAPQGVRLVLDDGTEIPVDVVYLGTDLGGYAHWEVITDANPRRVVRLNVKVFPPRCTIQFPANWAGR